MPTPLYTVQRLTTGRVSIMARPRGGDWLSDEIKALYESGVNVLVSLLTSAEIGELDLVEEAALCREQGINYVNFPILDRSVPQFSSQTFALLEQLQSDLSKGKHIAIHCRQGIGRSALIAASVLVLSGFAPDRAFDLLSKARGYTVPETEEQRAWIVTFAQRRH
jgi:protein-tyrosine phosphatase